MSTVEHIARGCAIGLMGEAEAIYFFTF